MQPLSSKTHTIDPISLELLIEEFVNKLRSRQNPDIEDFARRFPNHSNEIRETLEALAVIERVALHSDLKSEPGLRFGAQANTAKEYIGDFKSCARLVAAEWVSSTKPSKSHSVVA